MEGAAWLLARLFPVRRGQQRETKPEDEPGLRDQPDVVFYIPTNGRDDQHADVIELAPAPPAPSVVPEVLERERQRRQLALERRAAEQAIRRPAPVPTVQAVVVEKGEPTREIGLAFVCPHCREDHVVSLGPD